MPELRDTGFAPLYLRLDYDSAARSLLSQTRAAFRVAMPDAPWPVEGTVVPTLWELFHHTPLLLPSDAPAPVLIFDQFEEIFTLGRQSPGREHEAERWLEQMADLLQNRPPLGLEERFAGNRRLARDYDFAPSSLRVVFALREDYLSYLEEWKAGLPLLTQNRMALRLLNGPQALEAVLGPASLGDAPLLSREVAASIVRTVARVGANTPLPQIRAVPPLLSLLCEQLNAARLKVGAHEITAAMVSGQSADILQRFYEESYTPFPEQHREIIRALIEDPPMITEGGHRNSLVREDAEAHLTRHGVQAARAVFDALIQRRLITVEEKDRVQRLEVTHDVLVPLLLRSRKERRDRVERERALQAARAAQEQHRRLARERTLMVWIISAMAALVLLAGGGAWYGWVQARQAAAAESKAQEQILEAARKARGTARDAFDMRDDPRTAFAHLAEALRYNTHLPPEKQLTDLHADAAERLLSLPAADPLPLGAPMRHEGVVISACFSPDGQRVLTASADQTARVWDAAADAPLGVPMLHEGGVNSASFSPDGQRVLTASEDQTARAWDAATGAPLGAPMRHEGRVSSASFSPDGQRVLTACHDKTARVWDATTRVPQGEPMRHEGWVRSASFSPDGQRVVTASEDKTARVWNAATCIPLGAPMRHDAWVLSAIFSPDGRRILTASDDQTACVWDAATGIPVGAPMRHEGKVTNASFSPDGRRVLTASEDQTARVWDTATGMPLGAPMRHEGKVTNASFSPDGRRVLTACHDKAARVWDATTSKQRLQSEDRLARSFDSTTTITDDIITWAGRKINDVGQAEDIPQEDRLAWRARILSSSPGQDDAWHRLLRWKLADPRTRTITFHGTTTVPEHSEHEITRAWSNLPAKKEGVQKRYPNRGILTDAYNLDPGSPLIHLALAAVEENAVSREFLMNHGLKRLAAETALSEIAPHQLYVGTYRAKAAVILSLQDKKSSAERVFAELLAKHDPQRQTWGKKAWVKKLDNSHWPKVFRDELEELGNMPPPVGPERGDPGRRM